jgi:hypothetical protein
VNQQSGITALWLVHWIWRISFRTVFINSVSNKYISNVFYCTLTNQLTDFWATLYLIENMKVDITLWSGWNGLQIFRSSIIKVTTFIWNVLRWFILYLMKYGENNLNLCKINYRDQSFWLQIQRSRVRFPALPDILRSRGSGTGSTQPHEDNWGATWMKK